MLVTQILLIITITGLGMTDPAMNTTNVAILAVLVAFASASQDIVIDAYRRESYLMKNKPLVHLRMCSDIELVL